MITASTIYWIGILDSVGVFLTVLAICFFIAFISLIYILTEIYDDNDIPRVKKLMIWCGSCCLIVSLAAALIPSTRLAAAMYIVPAIANNEDVKAIGGNSLEALRLLTEDWLKELADTKGDKKAGNL